MEAHKQAVATIAATVRRFFDSREPYRIFHGATNSTRPRTAAAGHNRAVDISALHHVLHVDRARRVAVVEPNVPMDRLVAATLPHGLVPPVVMEFPGITAGGGFAGTAGESSSFRHGFFDQTVHRVEMVLANGDVVDATPAADDPRRDLFRGAAGALGTLGITTLLELKLVPARRYVKTTYHRCHSVAETLARLRVEATLSPANTNDYVDGILFAPDHGVVITGQMTDEEPPAASASTSTSTSTATAVQTFSHRGDPWFYLHVQTRTRHLDGGGGHHTAATTEASPSSVTEYIPLAEYLFRYDRGGFWVGRSAFSYFYFPFSRLTRWCLDDFLKTRMLYKALHASGYSANFIVQDLALPYATAEAFVDYTADKFGIWPLWLCPLQQPARPTFHPHTTGLPPTADGRGSTTSAPETAAGATATSTQMVNIGLWGPGPPDAADCVALNRDLEHRLAHEFGGRKWLYAHAYYDEPTFWQLYERQPYDALRAKYDAAGLPSVYDKVHVDPERHIKGTQMRWPLAGLWGLRHAIASKVYLPRTPPWRE
ncbi:FAD-binding domain containing protein [Niveomyces insectorum RCEF 264]|uniref:Delta(24)-sterol reductase n=1 Tax=Niveomyces insectorum RCEF 264 TaxID=1081102 RepID=A0A167QUB4_9HYPO|nr:FAD-binding domain containing protein [Niveomyces insectorum RCEF 264]